MNNINSNIKWKGKKGLTTFGIIKIEITAFVILKIRTAFGILKIRTAFGIIKLEKQHLG